MDTEMLRYTPLGAVTHEGGTTSEVFTCGLCAAVVAGPHLDQHREWHNIMAQAFNEALGYE